MLISVVIPVFNIDIALLKRSIDSVLDSNKSNIEVIIVDDGSYESNSKSYNELCSHYLLVKYVKKENGGPSSARNYGVDNANGEYVMFLDADDYLTKNCINEAETMCNETQADIVMGYTYKKIGGGGPLDTIITSHSDFNPLVITSEIERAKLLNHLLGYRDDIYEMGLSYMSDGPCARLFKKTLFTDNRFDLTPVWNEDTLWNIGLIKSAEKIVICKSLWYIYDVRTGSVTQGFRKNCIEEFSYITKEVCKTGKSLWGSLADKGIYYRVWHDIFFLANCYIFHPNNDTTFGEKYKALSNAFKEESYRAAIREVDFSCENSKSKRIVKEVLRCLMRMHIYFLSFIIICMYTKRGHA